MPDQEQRQRVMEGMEENRVDRERRALSDSGPEDERLREAVSARLAGEPGLAAEQVQVEVSGGEATLTGTVGSDEARQRAERAAASVAGVSYVLNNLRVAQEGTTGAVG